MLTVQERATNANFQYPFKIIILFFKHTSSNISNLECVYWLTLQYIYQSQDTRVVLVCSSLLMTKKIHKWLMTNTVILVNINTWHMASPTHTPSSALVVKLLWSVYIQPLGTTLSYTSTMSFDSRHQIEWLHDASAMGDVSLLYRY